MMSRPRGRGNGCTAGVDTIAREIGANYNNTAASVSKLKRLGYLLEEPHATDGRRSTYRVVYIDALDKIGAAFSPGDELPSRDLSPIGETSMPNHSPSTREVSRPNRKSTSPVESKNGATSRPYESKRNQEKERDGAMSLANTPARDRAKDRQTLENVERRAKSGGIRPYEVEAYIDWLQQLCGDTPIDDPDHERARRMLDELSSTLANSSIDDLAFGREEEST